jgi:hypothetical protein
MVITRSLLRPNHTNFVGTVVIEDGLASDAVIACADL